MHIEIIKLENFKAFESLEYNCNQHFNVIVGENNIGKSTIFEALNLWKFAYDKLIQARNKNKFYKAVNNYYISFADLHLVRLVDDEDIFFNQKKSYLSITVTIRDGNEVFNLKIKLEKPGIKNSYFRLFNDEKFPEFERFADYIQSKKCSLINSIFIYQTRPISIIAKNEPFYNQAQIEKKISIGKSHDVLRNKVLKTENTQAKVSDRFSKLEERLARVMLQKYSIRFKNKNRIDDEYVKITAEGDSKKELEISMMGSGFLQVVEIFSTIEYIEKHIDGVCLVLIDEPDSHIHSDLQSYLIDELKKDGDSQIFLITHNDRLVNKAGEGELFYLNSTVKINGILRHLEIKNYSKVKEDLSSVLENLEKNKGIPFVITEGKTDQKILTTAWDKLYPTTASPFRLISSGIQIEEESRNGGADLVRRTLEYISTLTEEKIVGIFDNDREGNEQFKGLNEKIFEPHNFNSDIRKHVTKDIYGLRLPVPSHRDKFVDKKSLTQRYFVIEHYFSDDILKTYKMKGESILETEVFEITGNKNTFADNCCQLPEENFKEFRPLFKKIFELLSVLPS